MAAVLEEGRRNLRLLGPEDEAGADRGESPREGRKCSQGGDAENL